MLQLASYCILSSSIFFILLLFTAVLRLLTLAARFASKVVRRYGLLTQKKSSTLELSKESLLSQSQAILQIPKVDSTKKFTRLCEMAFYLEVIRDLQTRLIPKSRRPGEAVCCTFH